MACLELYNNSQPPSPPPPMSPRISFSNDFVESHNNNSPHNFTSKTSELPPPSSDFEFSVTNFNTLTTADQLFFKGRLLPYKHNNDSSLMQRTLRDEINDDDDDADVDFLLKPPKGISSSSNRWKPFLGLRKSHVASRNTDKLDVSTFDSGKILDPLLNKSPQEMVSSDMEMRI